MKQMETNSALRKIILRGKKSISPKLMDTFNELIIKILIEFGQARMHIVTK